LHLGHLLHFFLLASFTRRMSSLPLSSTFNFWNSSQLIPRCQGTWHFAQNGLWQKGHSHFLVSFSSPLLFPSSSIAEQSLKGQYILGRAAHIASFHLSISSLGSNALQDSSSKTPLQLKPGQDTTVMLSWIFVATCLITHSEQKEW